MSPFLDRDTVDRYLRLLSVARRPPSLDALGELVAAHLQRVPFENVSKLHRYLREGLTRIPPIEAFLDGVERLHLGGTCYANNFHLYSLLTSLGYVARLCGADMRTPDVHLVSTVTLGGRDYLVDVGYGAPFLRPFRLDDRLDQVVAHGRDRYVLKPRDPLGRSRLEHHRDGALIHGYLVKPRARRVEEFTWVVARSFLPGSTFREALKVARFGADGSESIDGLRLTVVEGDRVTVTALPDAAALAAEAERRFGVPAAVTAEVAASLPRLAAPAG